MTKRRFVLLLPALLAVLLAAGCGGGGGDVSSGDVAEVGDVSITQAQFQDLVDRAKQSYSSQNQKFPKEGTADYDRVKDQAVTFLVQRAEFDQEAEKMGIKVSEQEIDKRLADIKKQYFKGSDKLYREQLKKQGLNEDEVRADIKEQLLSQKLFDKVTTGTTVSDPAVQNYYDSHASQYQQPESRTVRHILISVCGANTPGGTKCRSKAKAKVFAQQLFQQVKGGANIAVLAKKYSQDPGSAGQGGKLTITRGQTVAPFDQTAFTLGTGTVSAPIETQYGYHIIEPITDVKPATKTPFKQVKDAIEQQLLQQKKQEKMADWVNDLKKKYDIKYADGYEPASTTQTTTASTNAPATTAATTTTG